MRTVSTMLVAAVLVLAPAAACERQAEPPGQRDELVTQAREKMAELERRVDAIRADYEAHAPALEVETREDMARLIDKLERQRKQAQGAIDALGELSDTADSAADRLRDSGVKVRDRVVRTRAR